MAPAAKPPTGNRRGVVQRFTAKAGPLPVWAWALLILVVGYLVYRLAGPTSSSSSGSKADDAPDTTSAVTGDTGNPPAGGQGGPADNLNDSILSQLSGLSGQVDALTGLIQSTPAFDTGGGDSGSGSVTPNTGSSVPAAPSKVTASTKAPARPSAHPPAPAHVRYYSFQPGKAPKGRKKDEAPAKGPAGTRLHFKRGKGYFYA